MAINSSRLRVLRSLTGDSENGPIQLVSDADTGRSIKDQLGLKTSTPGPDPMIPTPQALEEQGYSTTFGGSEEQRLIDQMVLNGQMDPGEAMARKSGTWSPGAAEAAGTIDNLLFLNAQARKNELAATDFFDNLADTVAPQFLSDLVTGNSYQSYQQALQGFTAALSTSAQAQGRPAATEAAAAMRAAQFGVGVNDSPEEIALAQQAREHAISSLLEMPYPTYKPKQVWEGMKMLDKGAKPEVVSAYLESEGVYGPFFDAFWPKDEKYNVVRRPTGFTGTMQEQGYTDRGVDKWGRPVSVKVVGQ